MIRFPGGLLLCAAALLAQSPGTPAPQAGGMDTPWEIAPVLQAMSEHATRLLAALDRLDPNAWLEKGASPTYAEQLKSCKEQVKAVADTSKALARSPEQLAAELELLIRIHGIDTLLASVEEAVKKYQDPARAGELVRLQSENSVNRDKFQQYLISLAADREHALKVMDEEAQRCRGLLSMPSSPSKTGKKK